MKYNETVIAFVMMITLAGWATGQESVTVTGKQVALQARLYNQQRYTPQSQITVELRLTNFGLEPFTLMLSENIYDHIAYTLTDRDGTVPPLRRRAAAERSNDEAREVSLGANESLLFRDIISDRYLFASGSYHLTVTLSIEQPEVLMRAPSLRFTIFDAPSIAERMTKVDAQNSDAASATITTKNIADRERNDIIPNMPPDVVVWGMLMALQNERWGEVYSYLDLVGLYREDPQRNNLYANGNSAVRQQLLEEFRILIRSQNTPLFRIPSRYRVLRTEYSDVLAEVRVEVAIPVEGGEELYQLTYRLRAEEKGWRIYNISATTRR